MRMELGRAGLLAVATMAVVGAGCARSSSADSRDASRDGGSVADVKPDVPANAGPDLPGDARAVDGARDTEPDAAPDTAIDAREITTDAVAPADARVDAPDDQGVGKPDLPADMAVDAVWPDRPGDAGDLACSQDPSVVIEDGKYGCGTCESDLFFALTCKDGQLACATSYVAKNGVTVTVPPGQYVVLLDDVLAKKGQCAYLLPYTYAGFALTDPPLLQTERAPASPLVLTAVSSSPQTRPTFDWLVADRTRGESVIRGLVTLTDMTSNTAVAYAIADPVRNSTTGVDTVALQPALSSAGTGHYRVTVFPGKSQPLANLNTYRRDKSAWLSAPETTDFYTYSRPMVATISVVSKDGGKGYIEFDFTEALLVADLQARAVAEVAVDGAILSGCMAPYPCSGSSVAQTAALRMDVGTVPASFTKITLRVPHAAKSTGGGTVRDGTVGNPHASIDGDRAVYTFEAATMVLTDGNLVRRWYYTAD